MSQYSHNTVDITNKNTTWFKLFNLVQQKSQVLDVGCSSGYFANVLISKKNCTVDGVELNIKDAKEASKICRNVLVGSIEDESVIKEINQQYDYIIFADVLEHLVDPARVLKNISKFLKKNGCILFSVPNMAHISVILELLNGTYQYEDTGLLDRTHLHFYTKETVQEVIEKSGLYLDNLDYTSYDIPEHIINTGLKQAGLTADSVFFKNIEKQNQFVFQYVATLTPKERSRKPNKSPKPFKAIDENNLERKTMMDHIGNLENLNNNLSKELEKKTKETQVLNTKLGKVIKKIYRKQ